MKASELIQKIQQAITENGDIEILIEHFDYIDGTTFNEPFIETENVHTNIHKEIIPTMVVSENTRKIISLK